MGFTEWLFLGFILLAWGLNEVVVNRDMNVKSFVLPKFLTGLLVFMYLLTRWA
jgi:hypothetical protein